MQNSTRAPGRWNDRLVESYDLIADRYAEHRVETLATNSFDQELLRRYADAVRGQGRVCDLGCGPGVVAGFLLSQGVDVLGVDISQRMVDLARTSHPNILFHRGDMNALALRDGSLAGAVSFYSILHLARATVPQALGEMIRVLRPRGSALVTFYEGRGDHKTSSWFGRDVSVDTTLFEPGEMEMLLENVGFKTEATVCRDPAESEFPMRSVHVRAVRPER